MPACRVAIASLLTLALAGCGASGQSDLHRPAAAATQAGSAPKDPLVSGAERVAGRSVASWDVAWWQWRAALPNHRSGPEGNDCVSSGQPSRMWFLDDYEPPGSVRPHRRSCSIPAGDFVMFTIPSVSCTTVAPARERHAWDSELVRCASAEWLHYRAWSHLTLDGNVVHPLGPLLATSTFTIHTPGEDTIFGGPALRSGRAAVYGYALIFKPLSSGRHVLISEGKYRSLPLDRVTYTITVKA